MGINTYRKGAAIVVALILVCGFGAAEQCIARGRAHSSSTSNEVSYAAYPQLDAPDCYKTKNHDAADLCAQWRAAIAAERAASASELTLAETKRATNWAIAGIVVGAVTIIGLIISIGQTFGALREARRGNILSMRENARQTRRARAASSETAEALASARMSADAISRQVQITEQASRLQLRAYLDIDDLKLTYSDEDTAAVQIAIKNVGITPAIIKDAYAKFWIGPYDTDPATGGPEPSKNWHLQKTVVQNGVVKTLLTNGQGEDFEKICEEDKWDAFVYGRLVYDDMFNRRHEMTFAYCLEGWDFTKTATWRPCIDGNTST